MTEKFHPTADHFKACGFLLFLPTVYLFLSRLFALLRKRQSMIKLPCNKCNGCVSSSSHRLKSAGALIMQLRPSLYLSVASTTSHHPVFLPSASYSLYKFLFAFLYKSPNNQVSRFFRLINVEILVIVIYVFFKIIIQYKHASGAHNPFIPLIYAYGSFPKMPAKVLLFHEKAFANRTIRLSNRTKVTDYITACGKIDVQTQKIPAIQWVAGMGRGRERLFIRSGSLCLIENQILLSVRLLHHCKICLYVRRR